MKRTEKWQRDHVIPVQKSGKRSGTWTCGTPAEKKKQHDLDTKHLQAGIDQQQQSEMMQLMQDQQQHQQLLPSQQLMLRQQDQTDEFVGQTCEQIAT